jgi:hypothetical protein
VTTRYRQLAAHIRSLNDDDLNDLLVDLPRHRFTALVKVALAHPVVPAGLELRLESATPGQGWMVLAAFVRALGDVALNDLLIELPVDRFDALLDAAFPTQDEVAA